MRRQFTSISVITLTFLTVAALCKDAAAVGRHRTQASQSDADCRVPPPSPFIVPYTAYVAQPVGCLPPLGGFICYYQNSGYQTRAYKGCITKLP